jgi:predicted ATPase
MENKPILNSLHIENFRCFRKLDLTPLTRVNLLAGKNSVGKTAVSRSKTITRFTAQQRT